MPEAPPDHSTISRTRRLIDLETHQAIFTWIVQCLAEAGLARDECSGLTRRHWKPTRRCAQRRAARHRGDVSRLLTKLAQASGIGTPARADLARLDRKRKKKGSNDEWRHPHDPDARITKMKDGRTHLAHKAEHAVDLETGAVVTVTVQNADEGDTATSIETLIRAAEQVEAALPESENPQRGRRGHKGYHSNQSLVDLEAVGIRSSPNPIAGGGTGR